MIWEDLNWIREYRFPITSTDTSYEEITTQWGLEYINKLRQCVYIPANEADKIRTHIDNLLQSVHLFCLEIHTLHTNTFVPLWI